MLGIYPIVTQPVYLIGSPWFEDVNVTVNGNFTLRIRARGLDNGGGKGNGTDGFYVKSVKINGKGWGRNWFEHDDVIVSGGVIDFELGSEMVAWETGVVPPSPGHVVL
jgi:putative alpha-1,2-mannosidase